LGAKLVGAPRVILIGTSAVSVDVPFVENHSPSMSFPQLRFLFLAVLLLATSAFAADGASPSVLVGLAKIDITPELPIRLSGYQSRQTDADRAETRLFARALAIGGDNQNPAVLITVELIGIGAETRDFVVAALREKHRMADERVAICATHIHSGPALADVLPFMFSTDLPADEVARIARNTDVLRTKLVQVAEAALADRKPARLAWSEGKADFAAQRRVVVDGKWKNFGVVPEGPFDHALPVLRVTDEQGGVRGVFVSYACHCTTLGGGDNFVHHDWAGDAARRIESSHDGAVALVALGCGADANPNPRGIPAVAAHGEKVATEVERLLGAPMRPLGPMTAAKYRRMPLDLDHPVTRAELEQRTAKGAKQPASYAAMKFLQQLDAGRAVAKAVPYAVQTWSFGNDLAMVFLAGEVVSEYSLRLRRELDAARLWVNAYSNSVPSYIPSKRMFPEGGYEVDGSMDYYGWPTRLAIGTEDRIIGTVHELVPAGFKPKLAR
jgi:hypothetical protein